MEPIVNVVLPVFAIILAGFLTGQFRLLGEESSEALNRFVYYVALPVLLFYSLARVEPDRIFNWPFIFAFTAGSVVTMALAMLAARLLFRTSFAENTLFGTTAVWANTGYMGIPLVIVAFGQSAALPAIIVTVIQSMVLVPLITVLLQAGRGGAGVGKVLKALVQSPLVVAPILGMVWSLGGWVLPAPVETFCAILSPAAGPAALFAIGLFLVGKPIKRGFSEVAAMTGFKLIVHPLITWWCITSLVDLDPLWTAVGVLTAALPAGANCFVIAQNYGIYVHRTSAAILISTVVAVITVSLLFGMPVLTAVAGRS